MANLGKLVEKVKPALKNVTPAKAGKAVKNVTKEYVDVLKGTKADKALKTLNKMKRQHPQNKKFMEAIEAYNRERAKQIGAILGSAGVGAAGGLGIASLLNKD